MLFYCTVSGRKREPTFSVCLREHMCGLTRTQGWFSHLNIQEQGTQGRGHKAQLNDQISAHLLHSQTPPQIPWFLLFGWTIRNCQYLIISIYIDLCQFHKVESDCFHVFCVCRYMFVSAHMYTICALEDSRTTSGRSSLRSHTPSFLRQGLWSGAS